MKKLGKILPLAILLILSLTSCKKQKNYSEIYQRAFENYGEEVAYYAKKYKISASYLMALIMLESSGTKPAPRRFEPDIYNTLLKLKEGKIEKFENLTPEDLKNFTNKDLKKFSHSYGPFQIMGYKVIKLKTTVENLENEKAIAFGTYWINKEYGDLLRQGRFKDAFHYHNTGKLLPPDGSSKTHNPNYVNLGIEYMKYFSKFF